MLAWWPAKERRQSCVSTSHSRAEVTAEPVRRCSPVQVQEAAVTELPSPVSHLMKRSAGAAGARMRRESGGRERAPAGPPRREGEANRRFSARMGRHMRARWCCAQDRWRRQSLWPGAGWALAPCRTRGPPPPGGPCTRPPPPSRKIERRGVPSRSSARHRRRSPATTGLEQDRGKGLESGSARGAARATPAHLPGVVPHSTPGLAPNWRGGAAWATRPGLWTRARDVIMGGKQKTKVDLFSIVLFIFARRSRPVSFPNRGCLMVKNEAPDNATSGEAPGAFAANKGMTCMCEGRRCPARRSGRCAPRAGGGR